MTSRLVDKHRSHDEWLLGGLPDDDWPALTDEQIEQRAAAMKREEQRIKGKGNNFIAPEYESCHVDING